MRLSRPRPRSWQDGGPQRNEEEELRRTLETILTKDARAAAARTALEALNEPAATKDSYQARNRGEMDAAGS
jgi:hypothetical protein